MCLCGFLSLCPSAIPLTAYGPMAAAAAAAVVRGAQNQLYYGCCMIFYFQILKFVKLFPLVKYLPSVWNICLLCVAAGSTPSRAAGFLGTSSPGPMADLYAAANQDSVSSYISAASPAPSTGFGHGLGVGTVRHTGTYTNIYKYNFTVKKDTSIIKSSWCDLSCKFWLLKFY